VSIPGGIRHHAHPDTPIIATALTSPRAHGTFGSGPPCRTDGQACKTAPWWSSAWTALPDRSVLELVAEQHVLTTDQLRALVFPSISRVQYRLLHLADLDVLWRTQPCRAEGGLEPDIHQVCQCTGSACSP
jgi:hypothetical protein